jgi:hypothetical protein
MTLFFSDKPGCHERHLQRRYNNPLFPQSRRAVTTAQLVEARQKDEQDKERFMTEFQKLLESTAALSGQVDTEEVLKLKGEVEKLYIHCVSLSGDTAELKQALLKLHDAVVLAVREAAGNDALAQEELTRENDAWQLHIKLLEHPLVAHLLRTDSPIEGDELLPVLLSEDSSSLDHILVMFDEEQLSILCHGARQLMENIRLEGYEIPEAEKCLQELEKAVNA